MIQKCLASFEELGRVICVGGDGQVTVEEIVEEYGDMLFKVCMVLVCNEQDAQDAVQETFCRYMEHMPTFRSKEHEKAWLMKVGVNICRDMHRRRMRHPTVNIEEVSEYLPAKEERETLIELMNLPGKFKTVIYLHYVEGYKTTEIAKMLGITVNAVRKRMQRGREYLKLALSEEAGN